MLILIMLINAGGGNNKVGHGDLYIYRGYSNDDVDGFNTNGVDANLVMVIVNVIVLMI